MSLSARYHSSNKMLHLKLIKQTSVMEVNLIGNVKYPPGIRFCPSDEEIITHYLKRKVNYLELPAKIIADVDLYKYNPWDLPKMALSGDCEWYFFTPRDKKYPNGGRPNRTAVSGYWKATGKDVPVVSSSGSKIIGLKKVLVFYGGKPKKGVKMDWVMTEYRLPDASRPYRSKGCMRLDDWVLCRVRQKGNMSKNTREDDSSSHEFIEDQCIIPSVYADQNRDIFSDHLLSSEFRLMASLLNESNPEKESFPQTMTEQNVEESESSRFLVADRGTSSSCQQRGNNFTPIFSSNAYVNFQGFNMPAMADNFLQ